MGDSLVPFTEKQWMQSRIVQNVGDIKIQWISYNLLQLSLDEHFKSLTVCLCNMY